MTPFTSNKINLTVNHLFKQGLLPAEGLFTIDEPMLKEYVKFYETLGRGTKDFEWQYSRKVAGVMLLKLKFFRGGKHTSCREGIVYTIRNPAWNNHTKVGITIDKDKRLASLQTGDPFRAYYVAGYEFVLDRRLVEKKVLDNFSVDLENGEWLRISKSNDILEYIRKEIILGN